MEDAVAMVIDTPEMKDCGRKSVKRKRVESMSVEERDSRVGELRGELDSLLKFYNEVLSGVKKLELGCDLRGNNMSSMIACLLEERSLPLSRLVEEIYDDLIGKEGVGDGLVTLASVKSSVLLIGQRSFYGVPNPDADVLEDDNPSCLWCWETRDIKLLPKSERAALKIRRNCRKKIHERITAVSAVITELLKPDSHQNCRQDVTKVLARLGKVLNESEIRLLAESMAHKTGAEVAEKTVIREEKLIVKQLEKNKREVEKEKKKLERELQKEKLQSEKEQKRLLDELEKEERRREKEESEMKKQKKRRQEEEEKEQRRREKEEAELKRQLALQKQASLLERFLKKSKSNSPLQNEQSLTRALPAVVVAPESSENKPESVTQSMDKVLSFKEEIDVKELWKSHVISWHQLSNSTDRKHHWGARRKPKTDIVKEIKLTANKGLSCDNESSLEKLDDGWSEIKVDGGSCHINTESTSPSSRTRSRRKQLLQFDKSPRPAFYGIWPKNSQTVRPRHPLVRDPSVDYEIDSDEEWEEEEPGESLSDCDKDKDEEEESMEAGYSKADDEDESEDGFFVPDGYLSENEGVQVERMDDTGIVEEARSTPGCKQEAETEEFRLLFRQQKHIQNLTEHALRKNRPLVILNLLHEKTQSLLDKDHTGTLESEDMCLQALSMRAFPGGPSIEISGVIEMQDHLENLPSGSRGSTTPVATGTALLDEDLSEIVSIIQSGPQNITKLVESLHQKFPALSKSQLRNKVREISSFNFTDNRWQVKRDVLNKLGLSPSPDKISRGSNKSIVSFFSKRCLPPARKTNNPNEMSPQSLQKPLSSVEVQESSSIQ